MDPPVVTIQATLSRDGLLALRDAIEDLLGDRGLEHGERVSDDLARRDAERKVAEVWTRVGSNARLFLATAAQLTADGAEFTMNDVAAQVDRDPKSVRSWHRNLGRTLRQVEAAIPEPPLLTSRWDGERNVYRVPEVIREAILRRDMPPARE